MKCYLIPKKSQAVPVGEWLIIVLRIPKPRLSRRVWGLFLLLWQVLPITADYIISNDVAKRAIHISFWAHYKQLEGSGDDWYGDLFATQPPAYAYAGYLRRLAEQGQWERIINLVPKIDTETQKDASMQILIARAYKLSGQDAEASRRFISLATTFPTHPEVAFYAAEAYLGKKELHNALIVLRTAYNNSAHSPHNFLLYFMEAQVLAQMGDYHQALTCAQECIKKNPAFDKGYLFIAMLQEYIGNLHEAIKGYKSYLDITRDNAAAITQHVMQLTMKQHNMRVTNKSVCPQDSPVQQALLLVEKRQYPEAYKIIAAHVTNNPLDLEGKITLIHVLTQMGKARAAVTQLRVWIMHDRAHQEQFFEMIHALARNKAIRAHAIKEIEHIITRDPHNILAYMYKADLYTRDRKYGIAIDTYQHVLPLIVDVRTAARVYFQLAALYYDTEQYGKIEQLAKIIPAHIDSYPPLDNLLAYYFATEKKNPKIAQEYINRALKGDNSNPHFLDTQAVIWYQGKEYAQAKTLLKKLKREVPADATVRIHYAKTVAKLGDTKKAYKNVLKAQPFAQTTYEKQTIRRLLNLWKKHA